MAYKWESLNDQLIISRDGDNFVLSIRIHQLYTPAQSPIMLFASSLPLKRAVFPAVTRAPRRCIGSITNKGTTILDKCYDDVVITFAKRTAVGRAKKGQFKETPVDELLYALFKV
jgi:hypothetical protein